MKILKSLKLKSETRGIHENIEKLKRKNASGGLHSPSHYMTYKEAFNDATPAIQRMEALLSLIVKFDEKVYGRYPISGTGISASVDCGEGRSMTINLDTGSTEWNMSLTMRKGNETLTTKSAPMRSYILATEAFSSRFARTLSNGGFAETWVAENIPTIFDALHAKVKEEHDTMRKELDELVLAEGRQPEGYFLEDLYKITGYNASEFFPRCEKAAKPLFKAVKKFYERNKGELEETGKILWDAREALGYLPEKLLEENLFNEQEDKVEVVIKGGFRGDAFSMEVGFRNPLLHEKGKCAYRPGVFMTDFITLRAADRLNGFLYSTNADKIYKARENDEKNFNGALSFLHHVKAAFRVKDALPELGSLMMAKMAKIREVIAEEVKRELAKRP